jgi:hypothetical protein
MCPISNGSAAIACVQRSATATGECDFSALAAQPGPMGEPLRDPAYFGRVFLEDGAPTWPNGFDMCPDWLRQQIEVAERSY